MTHKTAIKTALQTVHVALADRSYDILIGPGLIADAGCHMRPLLRRPKLVIVTEETVAQHYLAALEKGLAASGVDHQAIILKPGEQTKSFAELESLTSALLDAGVERGDFIVALGGGVIGDLTGFAASILRRGVDFIQIPTTLLAQVDSSVGGKTGINTKQGKNLVGAFHQPRLVLADTNALRTLPPRDFRAGYAEVVKYGLIGDVAFFEWLDANFDALKQGDAEAGTQARIHAVVTSVQAKVDIVARDEREGGVRALLNLGHTFGHALEAATGFSDRLVHGEGVAVGMALAFDLSADLGQCPHQDATRVRQHLARAGLPSSLNDIKGPLPDADGLVALMAQDKKVVDGQLTLILAKAIGEAFITRDVPAGKVRDFLAGQALRPKKGR